MNADHLASAIVERDQYKRECSILKGELEVTVNALKAMYDAFKGIGMYPDEREALSDAEWILKEKI